MQTNFLIYSHKNKNYFHKKISQTHKTFSNCSCEQIVVLLLSHTLKPYKIRYRQKLKGKKFNN
jgi:hypothetical protein